MWLVLSYAIALVLIYWLALRVTKSEQVVPVQEQEIHSDPYLQHLQQMMGRVMGEDHSHG